MELRRPCAAILCAALLLPAAAAARSDGADGRFEKRTSSHFVLYQDVDIDESFGLRGSRRFEQQVLDTLEAAYDRLDAYLGIRPRRPLVVIIYDPDIFDAQFAAYFRFPAAGFYEGTIRIRGDTLVHQNLVRVLHHELVHAAFDAVAPSLLLPAWLNEGVAEWFEARAIGKRGLTAGELAYLSAAGQNAQLFGLRDLSAPSLGGFEPRAAQLAYLEAYAFIDHLARRHGERSLRELCKEFLRTRDLGRAFARTYRASLAELEGRFQSELGGHQR